MKTYEEFKEFYQTHLLKDLAELDTLRQKVLRNVIIAGVCAAIPILIITAVFMQAPQAGPGILIFTLIAVLVIFTGVSFLLTKNYKDLFKDKVIRRLVGFLDENLQYQPKDRIEKEEFMASKIFKTRPNRYKGDDLVFGTVGKTTIRFSELNAEYESGSGKKRSRHTVFRGLFFIGDFNKHFFGETVVLPDTAEKLFGNFGQMLQSWNKFRGQLIKLEDPEFEKLFVVYADDQVEARYILSTSLMERIVDFRKKADRKMYLSFVGSKIYAAISYSNDLFEPHLFKKVADFTVILKYFQYLSLAVGVVEDLNLNTRIWTKQ